jgi:diaminopimelate decarboxylase
MGGLPSQFGVDHDRVPALIRRIVDAGADWRGLHIFAGSQALQADALIDLQRDTVALAASIAEEAGHSPAQVNLGGGFGIPYFAKDQPLDVEAVGENRSPRPWQSVRKCWPTPSLRSSSGAG